MQYVTGLSSCSRVLSKYDPKHILLSSPVDRINHRHTAPGGYAEFIEYDALYVSPDGSLKEDSNLAVFNRMFNKAVMDAGMDCGAGPRLEGLMKDAGFVDVTVAKHPMPYGTWPADKHLVREALLHAEYPPSLPC